MPVRDYDPRQGQAFQGDVAIIPVPNDIVIATNQEIALVDGRLIIQEGEHSGHHHAIRLFDRVAHFRDDGLARGPVRSVPAKRTASRRAAPKGTAHLYRDATTAEVMVARGLLTRADLAIGCLVVTGGPVVISHEEHDGIRVPPGSYLVGRQVEGTGIDERMVID
jgi:hypothetical protein